MAEILAPAGSFEALTAAVRCGANAVYLGGKTFNARRNAANFSDDELKSAVEYCHRRGIKVYQTLNTLVGDNEFKTAYEAIRCACECNVDALILQDIGLAALVRRVSSSMPMHASTQMSVQSIEGIRMLEKAGFTRAVLPRELSENEIRTISSQTDTELEYFVHGALCMCLSGQCLMSSFLGGRSGNRGLCAQPCRLPFGVNGKGGNNLSLKDLSLVEELPVLEAAGVCSFKIEGRMKRPEYVAAAVTACKNSLNGISESEITDSLHAVFSRSGFTKGYFEGKPGKDMFGTRRKEDVEGAAPVLSSLQRLYDNEKPLITVNMSVDFVEGKPVELTAESAGASVAVTSKRCPEKALSKAVTREELFERISKCGGTQFRAGKLEGNVEDGLNVPASVINSLRREALEELEKKLGERPEKTVAPFTYNNEKHYAGKRELHARFFDFTQIPEKLNGVSRAIIPLDTPEEIIGSLKASGIQVAAEIPAGVFGNSEKFISLLNAAKENGADIAWICTLDGAGIAEKAGMPFVSGFGMNIFNTASINEIGNIGAADCLISSECTLKQASQLGGALPRGCFAYGRIPLMVTKNCPVKNKLSCAECKSKSSITDRMGVDFPVRCKAGSSYIFNSVPVWLADKKEDLANVDYELLYFTTESKEECKDIIHKYICGTAAPAEFTRGHAYKGVL